MTDLPKLCGEEIVRLDGLIGSAFTSVKRGRLSKARDAIGAAKAITETALERAAQGDSAPVTELHPEAGAR